MVKSKSYVFTQDYKAVYVVSTGIAHKPTQIKYKKFKKGQIIKGVLNSPNGKPSFVMVNDTLVVPESVLKQVVTKDISPSSSFQGGDGETKVTISPTKKTADAKTQYIDGIVLGTVSGLILAHVAEQKEWIPKSEESPYQNKLIGAVVGALAGVYIVFKIRSKKVGVAKTVSNG